MTDKANSHAVEVVIFDCDGVLVDSVDLSCRLLARELSAAGLATTPAQARAQWIELLLPEVVRQAERQLGRPLGDWLERFKRAREVAYRRELRAIPGAVEVVRALRAEGIGVCVASQGSLEVTSLKLEITGLASLIPPNARFSAYTVPRGKPHPDVFLHAAATMGSQPSRCLVVEDTRSGVEAAVSAGMRVIGYSAAGDPQPLRAAGAEVVSSMSELPSYLHAPP